MNLRTLGTPLLLALAVGALVAPASSSARSACTSGSTKVDGKPARAFCGSAKAAVKLGTKRLTFTGGECSTSGAYFTLNIGTIVINNVANSKPGPLPYFGIVVTPADTGVHLQQVLSWVSGGKRTSVANNRIALKKGVKSGSFSGTSVPGGKKVSGTFSC
jgi:hypothetical protein